jgi:hypothetical protein
MCSWAVVTRAATVRRRGLLVEVGGEIAVARALRSQALHLARDLRREIEVAVRGIAEGHARELLDLLHANGLLDLAAVLLADRVAGVDLEARGGTS